MQCAPVTHSPFASSSQISKNTIRSYLQWHGPAEERVIALSLVAGTKRQNILLLSSPWPERGRGKGKRKGRGKGKGRGRGRSRIGRGRSRRERWWWKGWVRNGGGLLYCYIEGYTPDSPGLDKGMTRGNWRLDGRRGLKTHTHFITLNLFAPCPPYDGLG